MTATEQLRTLDSALEAASRLRSFSFAVPADEVPDPVLAGGAPGRRLLWRSEASLVGAGEALRVPLGPSWASKAKAGFVHEVLNRIAQPVHPGPRAPHGRSLRPSGPVAMGALPYDPKGSGYLVVPEVLVTRCPGAAQVTLVVPGDEPAPGLESATARLRELGQPPPRAPLPDGFTLSPSMPHDEWQRLVRRAVAAISGGHLAKVVLARRVEVTANRPFVVHEALARLASLYPSCAVFHYEGFIGASPETLIRRTGDLVLSHPLAGTIARSGDPATDDAALAKLLASPKARHEHRLVVDAIASQLRAHCSELDVPPEPSLLALRNVSHLGTPLKGRLEAFGGPGGAGGSAPGLQSSKGGPPPGRLPTSLELAAMLQPTPAVGGAPTETAIGWQRAEEGFDRGWYAGPVGWEDAAGDGEWVLGLRSAHISGERAWLYAGNGIVAGSDPESELAETQLKLQALLAALVRP